MSRVELAQQGAISGLGPLLALIASGKAQSRSQLIEATGLSRSTITERLAALLATGFVEEGSQAASSGGRPARILKLNTNFGVTLVTDVGEKHIRSAVTDLEPAILAEDVSTIDLRHGPKAVLLKIHEQYQKLLSQIGRSGTDVLGIGLGLPAPVDYDAGRVVGPSVMAGWDDFDIGDWFASFYQAPVHVENDVNLMTLSEVRRFWPSVGQLLFIKAGTGIGSGIIADGRIYRGAQGAAGDIGHIQISTTANAPLCRCGKLGCVEAHAAGWAIARDLRAQGFLAEEARDVVELVKRNQPEAIQLVRQAGRVLGEIAAQLVSILNPGVIVVGGTLAGVEEHLLAGVRELVYQRSLPLATRTLQIVAAQSLPRTGLLLGAASLVLEAEFDPATVEQTIARYQLQSKILEGPRRQIRAAI